MQGFVQGFLRSPTPSAAPSALQAAKALQPLPLPPLQAAAFASALTATLALLLSLWPSAAAARGGPAVVVPLMELNGRVCFGHFYATTKYVDFYTQVRDCHNIPYQKSTITQQPDPYLGGTKTVQRFWLSVQTRQCPFRVVELTENHEKAHVIEVNAYQNDPAAESPDAAANAERNRMSCGAYAQNPIGYTWQKIKPASKRPAPIVASPSPYPTIWASATPSPIGLARCPSTQMADTPVLHDIQHGNPPPETIKAPRILLAMGHQSRKPLLRKLLASGDSADICVEGLSLLSLSALAQDTEEMALLLQADARVDAPVAANSGATALGLALSMGNWQSAQFLARRGANLLHVDDFGNTLLHALANNPEPERTEKTRLMLAVFNQLLRKDVPVNAANARKATPLHEAAMRNNIPVAQALLQNGANPCLRDETGQSAWDKASQENHRMILAAMRSHGSAQCPNPAPEPMHF